MPAKKFFAYIRVSTTRQGQTGTSLTEQRAAIEAHARRWSLDIIKEYEEQETAAKRGRPVFLTMLKELRRGLANGIVMHKIDRSARNLRDWAELGELIDKGIEVHFANENLDMYSRGGRLSADIQAVVAADYIRNLREEVKKGFYGRLKQGFYPMPAPVGYTDKGAGEAKEIDPISGPLVKNAFQLYASGEYGLRGLAEKMRSLGLRTRNSKPITANGLNLVLRNPFYTGVICLKKSGMLFQGQHLPIVSRKLFDQVQAVLEGRTAQKRPGKQTLNEVFLFRKFLQCERCRHRLIGERQKGNLYYRCHTTGCPQKTIREEPVENALKRTLSDLKFSESEITQFQAWHQARRRKILEDVEEQKKALSLRIKKTQSRLSRLTDALADGLIDGNLYTVKKNALVIEEREIADKLESVERVGTIAVDRTVRFLELANSAYSSYEKGNFERKRDLIRNVTSNFFITGKTVVVKPNLPFELLLKRNSVFIGGPYRDSTRTFREVCLKIFQYFLKEDTSNNPL